MTGITVLAIHDRISCFHSLMPFFFSADSARLTFTDSAEWCLTRDRNDVLILLRLFIKPDRVDEPLLQRLRDRYRRVAFFHDD
ncbi:MAG TPA: hypothetical protein VMG58_09895, partial [Candidatus Sulfotelmatobacter sp.]|nr:hypothetical protein [Candidatus Sulfotelmatobacter sp.]